MFGKAGRAGLPAALEHQIREANKRDQIARDFTLIMVLRPQRLKRIALAHIHSMHHCRFERYSRKQLESYRFNITCRYRQASAS
jgi:hypothetical protein